MLRKGFVLGFSAFTLNFNGTSTFHKWAIWFAYNHLITWNCESPITGTRLSIWCFSQLQTRFVWKSISTILIISIEDLKNFVVNSSETSREDRNWRLCAFTLSYELQLECQKRLRSFQKEWNDIRDSKKKGTAQRGRRMTLLTIGKHISTQKQNMKWFGS